MLPAPGQGALAIETRMDDTRTKSIAAELNHPTTALAVFAERRFLQHMGGGCNVPVGVYAHIEQNIVQIDGLVASLDGKQIVRDSIRQGMDQWNEAAETISRRILSRGGREILNAG